MTNVKQNLRDNSSNNRKLNSLFLLIAICFLPQVVFAQQQVTMQIEGTIQTHCSFDDGSDLPESARAGIHFDVNPEEPSWNHQSRRLEIGMVCNAPFTLAVRSLRGGLLNSRTTPAVLGGEFVNQITYRADVNMTTEDASSPLQLSCQSSEMIMADTPCLVSSGTKTATGPGAGVGAVEVTLSGSSGFPLQDATKNTIVLALALQ